MDVSAYDVANFFEDYETSKTATRANSKYMADYSKVDAPRIAVFQKLLPQSASWRGLDIHIS